VPAGRVTTPEANRFCISLAVLCVTWKVPWLMPSGLRAAGFRFDSTRATPTLSAGSTPAADAACRIADASAARLTFPCGPPTTFRRATPGGCWTLRAAER
jgi:hypothetical protein